MAEETERGSIRNDVIKDRHVNSSAGIQRTKLEQRALADHPLHLTDFRVWDALATPLPATPAADDLGLVTGTYGTDAPQIQTGDVKALGATTRRARVLVQLPDNYDAGEDVVLRAVAMMKTTLADTSGQIDVEAYKINSDGTLSADLVTTSAISINTGVNSLASRDFTVTPTTLIAGDRLDVRISFTITDAAGATPVIGVLHDLILRCDIRP